MYFSPFDVFYVSTNVQGIKLSEKPSRNFNDLKTCINYDSSQNYNKNTTSYEYVSFWIDEFITNIGIYLKKPYFRDLIKKK